MIDTARASLFQWMDQYSQREKGLRIFECAIAFWMIAHSAKLLALSELLTSKNNFCPAIIGRLPFGLDSTLLNGRMDSLLVPLLLVQIVIAFSIIFRGSNYLSRTALWFLHVNIIFSCSSLTDGGTTLLSTLLFFYIFCDFKNIKKIKSGSIQQMLFCLVVFSMQLQICLVYIQAALSKIRSEGWANGVSLHYVLQAPEFSIPLTANLVLSSDWLIVFAAYATIVFQLIFPFAMISRHFKLVFLLTGCLFHVGIALTMGLVSFGTMMTLIYFVFLTNNDIAWIKQKVFRPKVHSVPNQGKVVV